MSQSAYIVLVGEESTVRSAATGLVPVGFGITTDPSRDEWFGMVVTVKWGTAQRLAADIAEDFSLTTSPHRDFDSAEAKMGEMLGFPSTNA